MADGSAPHFLKRLCYNYGMNSDTRSQRRAQGGFTIVETLIVVAVSSVLLVSAVTLVAGRQRKVEFNQAAQDLQSVIRQVASETSAGHYPSGNNFTCTAPGGTPTIVAGVTKQGSNTNCIFLGRAIQFGNGSSKDAYVLHTIAGYQKNNGSIAAAKATAIDLASARTIGQIRNGLTLVSMRYVDGATTADISGVAFLQGLGAVDRFSNFISGSQLVTVVPFRGNGPVTNATINTIPLMVTAINTQLNSSAPINPSGGVQICLQGGVTDQWALITIGSNGRGLSVTLDYKSSSC